MNPLYIAIAALSALCLLLILPHLSPRFKAAEAKVVADVQALEPAAAKKVVTEAMAAYDAALARAHAVALGAKADAEIALAAAEKALAEAQAFKAALAPAPKTPAV